ncbi:MAG: hypothetical protein ACLSUW_01350 [Akkermansia sp.]
MLFDDLLNNPAKWMVESKDEHDIVLTSRIRLARNLTATLSRLGHTPAEEETLKLTSGEARQIPVMKGGYYAELWSYPATETVAGGTPPHFPGTGGAFGRLRRPHLPQPECQHPL